MLDNYAITKDLLDPNLIFYSLPISPQFTFLTLSSYFQIEFCFRLIITWFHRIYSKLKKVNTLLQIFISFLPLSYFVIECFEFLILNAVFLYLLS